jgi:hypothetical protein
VRPAQQIACIVPLTRPVIASSACFEEEYGPKKGGV